MNNKCPKCGYEYNKDDIFCARCGYRLRSLNNANEVKSEPMKDIIMGNLKEIVHNKSTENKTNSGKNISDSIAYNIAISMIIVSFMLIGVVFAITDKQNSHRQNLHYKSLISNPARIPELKEPKTFDELASNLKDVENFLTMYMSQSDNPQEKKEQIFALFLNEMDKMPHITNESVLIDDKNNQCANITGSIKAQKCADKLNKTFKNVGIKAYANFNTVYLYPDNKFIKRKYNKYLTSSFRQYINLRAKYNEPTTVGLNMYIEPKVLANKIYDYEKLYNAATNSYIKDQTEYQMYEDFRKYIFTPSIYNTTTHEMTKEFKNSYEYFIKTKKKSALYPVILSYMDKKRSYDEDNFRNDYPYKIFESTFEQNVKNNTLSDIFAQLRKNIFSNSSEYLFTYIYSTLNGKWYKYEQNTTLEQNDYVISEADENNNAVIYNNTFAPTQELNISKYGRLFLHNGGLFVFNSDKLQISRISYNGRAFQIRNLSSTDVTSVFPGIEVINIDSYSNYNIYIEKENQKANYIILSRYSQGYSDYILSPIKGDANILTLPNIFSVNTVNDTIVAFHGKDINPEATSESAPTYKFIIHTHGQTPSNNSNDSGFVQYDQKTADESDDEEDRTYRPNIMPKIPDKNEDNLKEEVLKTPPAQILEPPNDSD